MVFDNTEARVKTVPISARTQQGNTPHAIGNRPRRNRAGKSRVYLCRFGRRTVCGYALLLAVMLSSTALADDGRSGVPSSPPVSQAAHDQPGGQQGRPAVPPVSVSAPAAASASGKPGGKTASGSPAAQPTSPAARSGDAASPSAVSATAPTSTDEKTAPAVFSDSDSDPNPASVTAPAQPQAPRRKTAERPKQGNHLLIPLPDDESVGQQEVEYTCSIDEKKAGDEVRSLRTSLPAERFTVTYLSADIMALAVLPVDGRVMVFANVVAGDGAKYVGDRYSWWAKGDDVTFAREDRKGVSFACHAVTQAGQTAQPASNSPQR